MKNASRFDREGEEGKPFEIEYRFERALTIVVPALNEAEAIREVIEGLMHVATECLDRFEIVAINDGSADNTGIILDELMIRYPQLAVVHHSQRKGVGAGFRSGLALATTPFITVVPGDGAYPPENLRAAFKMVGRARHIGSIRKNQQSARGPFRSLLSWAYNFGVGWLLQVPVSDLHSLHIYSVDLLRQAILTQDGYLYGIEALAAAGIDPHDLDETKIALASDRHRPNRSLHLSTVLDLLSALVRLSHRLFAGLKERGLLLSLAVYSLVWMLICWQFRETPHLQDLIPKVAWSSPSYLSYLAGTLAALPLIMLLPVALGLLLLSLLDRRNNVSRPSDDHVLLSGITGAAAIIPLGVLLGAAGLLVQPVLVPLCLAVVWLGLLRHPGALRALFEYALLSGAKRPSVALIRLAVLTVLLLVLFGKALPVDVWSTDVMQIYYAFLARVKAAGSFRIDPSVPDLTDFLIGRGNGLHLIFATMIHPYIGGLISFAYVCGILLLVRRIGALLLNGALGKRADPTKGAWPFALDLLVLATLTSTILRSEFAKYHVQVGFFIAAGLYLLVLQFHRQGKAATAAMLATATILAVAVPLILPQHLVFAGILLGAVSAAGLAYRNWKLVLATASLGIIAALACLLSMAINYAFVGTPELYPISFFARFADPERFGRLSSFEIWRYIYLAQDLNDRSLEVGLGTAERFATFLGATLLHVILLGLPATVFSEWIDAHWIWLANAPWLFAFACLIPLSVITLIVLYKPRTRILPVTLAVLILTPLLSYIAGQGFNVFIIGVPTTLYAVISATAAALIAAAIAKPASLADMPFEGAVGKRFVGEVLLSLTLVLLGLAGLNALVPAPSIGRMFLAFAPLTSVLAILFICVCANLFWVARSNAMKLAGDADRLDRYKVANPGQVVACLIFCTAVPSILIGFPASRLGADTPFTALSIGVHLLIVVLAAASLYGLIRPAPGSFKGLSLAQWRSLDMLFVSRAAAAAIGLFALTSVEDERNSIRTMVEQVVYGPKELNGGWRFDRCIEMAGMTKGHGRILPVNAPEQAIPCYAPIGIPHGTFVHHYNSLLAPHYALVLYGSPDEVEAFYRANNVNFFYFDRQEGDYIWGHGFNSLFNSDSLLRRFDVAHEAKDYFLLTWRGQGLRPVDTKIADELARLRQIKIQHLLLAETAYERLRQELRNIPKSR